MIYGRFGNPVEIVRRGTVDDVRTFDHRKPDQQDRDAVKNKSYVVIKNLDNGSLQLAHLCYLRADGGSKEISEAIEQLPRGFFFVAAFDDTDMPRAWGRAETLDEATDEATRQANLYLDGKRDLGEPIALRLFECRINDVRRDLHTTITHATTRQRS